jgi:hypothetical protein
MEARKRNRRKIQRRSNLRLAEWRKDQARLIRWWLFDTMGNYCHLCGITDVPLELDHPNGRSWNPVKLGRYDRARAYLLDWAMGNLRPLCCSCNKTDGSHRRWGKGKYANQGLLPGLREGNQAGPVDGVPTRGGGEDLRCVLGDAMGTPHPSVQGEGSHPIRLASRLGGEPQRGDPEVLQGLVGSSISDHISATCIRPGRCPSISPQGYPCQRLQGHDGAHYAIRESGLTFQGEWG